MSRGATLVVGLGSDLRGDDAVGLLVARELVPGPDVERSSPALPPLRVLEHRGDLTGLIDYWGPRDSVIVVDALASGVQPGTLSSWDLLDESIPVAFAGASRGSSHGLGLSEIVALARAVGRLPRHLHCLGIEGVSFAPLSPPSAIARAAAKRAVARILTLIQTFDV